ncbi:MAG TPA: YlzJ-like family protein [Syntrophomonadaceae bacterium]|nr:YlzJ-like family protein [Syntrophomonadaceae bacterium]HQE22503.1 YlzJ-like family protein [Syntrophomonadaceae bacterium]
MILYIPEPFEFPLEDKKPTESFSLKLRSGGELVVENCGQNQVRVIQVRSTDPMDYINSKFQPGNIIDLVADFE